MASKASVNKGDSKSNKSHRMSGAKSGTAKRFGIWSTATRVLLAFFTIVILILIIVFLIKCLGRDTHCILLAWIISFVCMLIVVYGLWGIWAEAFWAIVTLALNLFLWSIIDLIDNDIIGGVLGLSTCFVASIYAYMIWKSGLPLSGVAGCCCFVCIC